MRQGRWSALPREPNWTASLKKILKIGIPLLLLLAGGGGVAWWYFMEGGREKVAEVVHFEPDPGALNFQAFVVPVLQNGNVTHHLTLRMTVELSDEDFEEQAARLQPRVKDAVIRELHGLYHMRLVREQGFDTPFIRERLTLAVKNVLGDEVVTGITLKIHAKRKPTET